MKHLKHRAVTEPGILFAVFASMWKGLLIVALPAASLYAILSSELGSMRNVSSGVTYQKPPDDFVESFPCKAGQCGYEIRNSWRSEIRVGSITIKGAADNSVKKAVCSYLGQLGRMVLQIPASRAELVRVRGGYEIRCSSIGVTRAFRVTGVCGGSKHVAAAFCHAVCHEVSEFLYHDSNGAFRIIAAHYMNACLSYEYYLQMQRHPPEDDENWYAALESLTRAGCDVFKMSARQIRERAAELKAVASGKAK